MPGRALIRQPRIEETASYENNKNRLKNHLCLSRGYGIIYNVVAFCPITVVLYAYNMRFDFGGGMNTCVEGGSHT